MLKKIAFKWRVTLAILFHFLVMHAIVSMDFLFHKKYYFDPLYNNVWSKIMMPQPGFPPLEFFLASKAMSLVVATILVIGFLMVRKSFQQDSSLAQGALYGGFVFCVGIIPTLVWLLLFVNLPFGLLLGWSVEHLVGLIIASSVTGWLVYHPQPLKIA